ncbi:hypothetical protein HanHA300_Chr15g0585921 [Helianthus annuus]|nr:hypothetical protein HanHA300_Chr15g0585921 [Helianthus annuus]
MHTPRTNRLSRVQTGYSCPHPQQPTRVFHTPWHRYMLFINHTHNHSSSTNMYSFFLLLFLFKTK